MDEKTRLTRPRRNLPAALVASRAGIDRGTLGSIENGRPSVSMGATVRQEPGQPIPRPEEALAHLVV